MSDLIVKGAGEIKDGLYNIKGGKLFQYKENGGTVRTYQIVSADRPTGHWIVKKGGLFESDFGICSICGNYLTFSRVNAGCGDANFCPNCGADMRGGEKE